MRRSLWLFAVLTLIAAGFGVLGLTPPGKASGSAAAAAVAEGRVTDPVPLLELRTADGGWFWTLSQAEAATAGAQYGMTLQPTRLGYLRRQAFPGSQAIYRLRARTRSAYLLTASASERDQLAPPDGSGAFAYEGVAGYAWAAQAPRTAVLWRMTNGSEWRVVPDAQRSWFLNHGYSTDGPLGYVLPTYVRPGAIYFGTWDAAGDQRLLDAAERVYGRGDWWAGVRDFAGSGVPRNAWHWSGEDFSDLEPSIGYYDDSQPATLERQTSQAADAGLDHFSFYWYWNPADGGVENYVAGLRAYLQAANRLRLDFTIMPCLHPWSNGPVSLRLPADQIDRAAQVLVDNYLSQSNYLRANDGRKVMTVCDTRGIGAGTATQSDLAQVRRFTDAIRARARTQLGEDVLITHNTDLSLDTAAAGFDGRHCQGQFDPTRSYQHYVDSQRANFAAQPGVLIRCVTSDFDERPRIGLTIPDPSPPTAENLRAAFRWYDDQSLDRFRSLLSNVRQDIDASTRPQLVDNMVLVYAWNEWHEGGYVEPNTRYGCTYLNAIRADFRVTNGAGCVAATTNPLGSLRVTTPCCTSRYLRHQDSLGITSPVSAGSNDLTKQDSTFWLRPGLASAGCFSFESRNYPGRYLRHSNYRIRLDARDGTAIFAADATFCRRAGHTAAGVSFESYNYPGRFLRHINAEVHIAANGGPYSWDNPNSWAEDTTWQVIAPWGP